MARTKTLNNSAANVGYEAQLMAGALRGSMDAAEYATTSAASMAHRRRLADRRTSHMLIVGASHGR